MEIGERIRRRREALSMTQDDLAEKVGYTSRSSIAKIESGANQLTQRNIAIFAEALDMYPSELLGITDETLNKQSAFDSELMTLPGLRQLNDLIKKNRLNDDFTLSLLQYAQLLDEHYDRKKYDNTLADKLNRLSQQDRDNITRIIDSLLMMKG